MIQSIDNNEQASSAANRITASGLTVVPVLGSNNPKQEGKNARSEIQTEPLNLKVPPFKTDTIPSELQQRSQWVCWRYESRGPEKDPAKPPLSPLTGQKIDHTDPATWSDFSTAVSFAKANEIGIAFAFSPDDPYAGIDLDECIDPKTGAWEPWALTIIDDFDSYTERSPSGTGVKIFVKGKLPGSRNRKGKIEMYDRNQPFTLTGDRLDSTSPNIEERQAALDALYSRTFGNDQPQAPLATSQVPTPIGAALTDSQIIQRALFAANGGKFSGLFSRGNTSDYDSESEADLALCSMLAFHAGPDRQRIDQLFRRSKLYREKWDREDYREATITKALQNQQVAQSNQTPAPASPPSMPRFRLLTLKQLKEKLPPLRPLIEGIIGQGMFAAIIGPSGSGKSLLAIDWAMSVATGSPWQGRFVVKGVAVYVLAERRSGFDSRVDAWRVTHPTLEEPRITFVDAAPRLLEKDDIDALLKELDTLPEKPTVIIVDTLAKSMVGYDENNTRDMGILVANCERIRDHTGATVVVVHHTGHDQTRPRGNTALLAGLDTMLMMKKHKEGRITLTCEKLSDMGSFEPMGFKVVEAPASDTTTAPILRGLETLTPSDAPKKLNASQQKALDALREKFGPEGANYTEWLAASQLPKSTFKKAIEYLQINGNAVKRGKLYALITSIQLPNSSEGPRASGGQS